MSADRRVRTRQRVRFALALAAVTLAFLMPLDWLQVDWVEPADGGWLSALPLDKFMHLLLLAVLGWLGLDSVVDREVGAFRRRRSACLSVLGGLIVYACVIEVLQQATGHRSAEVADVLAGVLGLIGASLCWSRGLMR